MIASSYSFTKLKAWGSHPLTDPLFSTSHLRIIHDGAFLSRIQKLEHIVHSDVAMRYLRVCWKSGSDVNCCACGKCYRTMAALAALGALDRFETFKTREFRLEKVARIFHSGSALAASSDLESLALRWGNRHLARAVRRSVRYSRYLNTVLPVVRRFKGRRVVGRLAENLENRLLAGALT